MPAPWLPDATKDATLSALASGLDPDSLVHSGTAWNMVRGLSGFENIDNVDDLFYVRYNWPGISGQALARAAKSKEAPKKEAPPHK
jgi:hypothetical protein